MTEPIIILMDDVHLEGRDDEEQKRFAIEIQHQINEIKSLNKIPIVVCAGDIGEGIRGLEWVSQFDTDIIYVCGNHEFWNQDFYETLDNMNKYLGSGLYPHIHLLYNKTIHLHGIRFIGSTLWTGMGEYLPWYKKNNVIKFYGAMGDFKRIKAKSWYSHQNKVRLTNFLSYHGIDNNSIKEIITQQQFNPLLEQEENNTAIEFLIDQLSTQYDGKTVVVSHHLPVYELWMKKKNIPHLNIEGESINDESSFYQAAKGKEGVIKDILMMGYYANDLKEIMYSVSSPNYWFHGHLHQQMSDVIGITKIISSPVGYKKQSNEIKYKTININNETTFLKEYVKKEIENYGWNEKLLNNVREFERLISKFQVAISSGILSAYDFEYVLKKFQDQYISDIHLLLKESNIWLKYFLYNKNKGLLEEKLDFYTTIKNLDITNLILDGKSFKFPEKFDAQLNEDSFLEEIVYEKSSYSKSQGVHFKEWLKQLQQIQIQISQYKKFILTYCENYK